MPQFPTIFPWRSTSGSGSGGALTVSAGASSGSFSALTFSNASGVSFGLDAGVITATVQTNYQSAGPYLTTAQPVGAYLTTAALSQDSSKYAGTNATMTGGSLTVNTSGVSINLPAYLTTAMLSNRGSDFVQATAAFAGTNAAGTIGSAGISVSVAAQTVQPVAASGSNGSVLFSTLAFVTGNGASFYTDASGVRLSYTVPSVPAQTQETNTIGMAVGLGTTTMAGAQLALYLQQQGNLTFNLSTAGAPITAMTIGISGSQSVQAEFGATLGVSTGGNTLGSTGMISRQVVFVGGTNITLSMSSNAVNGTAGTITIVGPTQSAQTVGLYASSNTYLTSSGTVDARSLSFRGDKSITVGVSAGEVVFSVGAYLTTAALSGDTTKYAGVGESVGTVAGTDLAMTVNTDGVSVLYPKWITTYVAGGGDAIRGIAANGATISTSTVHFSNSNGVSFGFGAAGNSTVMTASHNAITTAMVSDAGSRFVNTSAGVNLTGSIGATLASNSVSFSIPAFITTADLSANSSKYAQNWKLTSNTAGTTSSNFGTDLWLAGGQGITLSGSSNSITFSVGSYITTGMLSNRGSDFVQATAAFAGTNASGTIGSAGISVSVAAPGGAGNPMSFFEHPDFFPGANSSLSNVSGSSIWVQPFILPYALSVSFVRVPVSLSAIATTFAGTSAAATNTVRLGQTDCVVIYSQGVGASSLSLRSYASGSTAWTLQTKVQAGTAGSQNTISLDITYPTVSGGTSEYHTSYGISTSNYLLSTLSHTLFTGPRWMDIPFATSLSAGNYWIGFGRSTSTAAQVAGLGALTNASIGFSTIGLSQAAISIGYPGAVTHSSIGLQPGAGAWTTNAFVSSTASIGINSVSAQASNPEPYFQMIRFQ